MKTYLDEDNELFKSILYNNYFLNFQNNEKSIEFILSGLCSSNCGYCYMKQHQKELFPVELYDIENIIKNFNLLLKWYIENKFNCNISLFSGEWLTTPLMEPIFEGIYNNFKDLQDNQKPGMIVIPDNMNFINNDELTNKIQQYIDLLKSINITIQISASVDGKYCDFDRITHTDDFYKKCFEFCKKNNYFFHPMISSNNIKYWKENYLWWWENIPKDIMSNSMIFEIRDETWDEESVAYLLNFCDFLIDFKLENFYNNDLIKFTFNILNPNVYSPENLKIRLYENFKSKGITCSLSKELSIRVADLSLVLCHRLSYKELILGQFIIKDNEIVDIKANEKTVNLLSIKAHFNRACAPRCEKCVIEPICPGFCCGVSYENFKNILFPSPISCDMLKLKYTFLIQKYNNLGIFKLIENNYIELSDEKKQYILTLRNTLINGE